MSDILELFSAIRRPTALFEIVVLWVVIYGILRFLRGSLGLGILRGLLLIGFSVYLIAQVLTAGFDIDLPHLERLFRPSITILLTALVIIFQPEIRRAFTRLGENQAFDRLTASNESVGHTIAECCERLSRRRVGALIAIERSTGLRGYTEGAQRLNADIEAHLLESVFQPGGPLHDGAVLIRGGRLVAAGCLFPLTEDPRLGPEYGTRHRAAIGVTEETDALAIVVSEETGRISLARRGALETVKTGRELGNRIDEELSYDDVSGEA